MTHETAFLCFTAASVGFVHTVLGPDHYVPFVALSRAGGWSLRKTMLVTLLCGVAHVLSSVVLGVIGIAFGIGVLKLEALEGFRADVAGWLLLAFGVAYFVWGVRRAIVNRPHAHRHVHVDGTVHSHEHTHKAEHVHVHTVEGMAGDGRALPNRKGSSGSMTPWVLFTVFVFGPCEPLIPLVMYPAAKGAAWDVVAVTVVFGVTTLATMTTAVLLAGAVITGGDSVATGLFRRLGRYSHALAGVALLLCGIAVKAGL